MNKLKEKTLIEGVVPSSKAIEDCVELAKKKVENGDFDGARKVIEGKLEAILAKEDKACLYYDLGGIYCNLNNIDKAIVCFEESLELISQTAKPDELIDRKFLNYVFLYYCVEDSDELENYKNLSIEVFGKIKENYRQADFFIPSMLAMVNLYGFMGDHGKSISLLQEFINDIKDDNLKLEALVSLAQSCAELNDSGRAMEYYEEALLVVGSEKKLLPEIYYGMALLNLDSDLAALRKYIDKAKKAIKAIPESLVDKQFVLGLELLDGSVLYGQGMYKKAIKVLKGASQFISEKNGDFVNLQLLLAKAYYAIEDYKSAVKAYELALECAFIPDNDKITTLLYLSNAYNHIKDYTNSVKRYEQLLSLSAVYRDDPNTLYDLVMVSVKAGREACALGYIERIIKDYCDFDRREEALSMAIRLCIHFDREEQARIYYNKLSEEFPESNKLGEVKSFF